MEFVSMFQSIKEAPVPRNIPVSRTYSFNAILTSLFS